MISVPGWEHLLCQLKNRDYSILTIGGPQISNSEAIRVGSMALTDFTRPGRLEDVFNTMLRAGDNHEQAGVPGKTRLPITPVILRMIYKEWEVDSSWDHSMLWACICLCFFEQERQSLKATPALTHSGICLSQMLRRTAQLTHRSSE